MSLDSGQIRYPHESPPAEGEAIEIAEGVLWFRFPLPMKLDHVNVFVFDDGDAWTIVDTGFDTKRARGIWRTVLEGPLAGKPVKRVLATHHHPDHIGLAGWFQSEFGAELLMTRTAWALGRMLQMDEQPTPVAQSLAFWKLAGMAPEIYEKRITKRPFNFADMVA